MEKKNIKGKILGLDIGSKYIGCAISDDAQIIVTPLSAIIRSEGSFQFRKIKALIEKHQCQAVVSGIPYLLDGNSSEQTKIVKNYLSKLKTKIECPIFFFDERLSTWEIKKKHPSLTKMKKDTKREGIKNLDSFCAAEILKNYLGLVDALKPDLN